jgi:parallel beta-helix repeat protein
MFTVVSVFDTPLGFVGNSTGATLYVNTTGVGGAYTRIQDAIDNASDGDIVYVYSGIYYEKVLVNKMINLTGENKEVTVIDSLGDGTTVSITAAWANFSGFTVTGSRTLYPDAGIRISNSNIKLFRNIIENNTVGILIGWTVSNVSVFNNKITNNKHGISINNGFNSSIDNNIILNNNFTGISIVDSPDNVISNNYILNNGGYGLSISTSSSSPMEKKSRNNTVINNNFEGDGVIISGYDLPDYNTQTIPTNNIINGKPLYYYKNTNDFTMDGIPVGHVLIVNCTNFTIKNLKIDNTDVGIRVLYSENMSILKNEIRDNLGSIHIARSDNITVESNEVSNVNYGIYVSGSSNGTLLNNNVSESNWTGISLSYSSRINVSENNIIYSNHDGIYLVSSPDSNIIQNNIKFNGENGIYLYRHSDNNLIKDNNISSNDLDGIRIYYYSNNNILSNNSISYNKGHGMNVTYSSEGNLIYHNSFIDNTISAYDESYRDNQWDNGYPSGGNYWSDYTYNDKFYGEFQDIFGSDGIGDTPYQIDPETIDNYPLIQMNADIYSPRINLISPSNNSIISSGTQLDFEIFDEYLKSAFYSINWKTDNPLSHPFNISTEGWGNGEYLIHIKTTDYAGNTNIKEFYFTIDATLPRVASCYPLNNSFDVDVNITISINFSEPVNITNFENYISIDPQADYNWYWDFSKSVLNISFNSTNLDDDTQYKLIINSSIIDFVGNPMNSDFILEFTTLDLDYDDDGTPDGSDFDDDNDGYPDESDAFPLNNTEWLDTDLDGLGNNADSDDDNDGIPDKKDNYPLDSTRWEKPKDEDSSLYILFIIIIIGVVALIFMSFYIKKKKEPGAPASIKEDKHPQVSTRKEKSLPPPPKSQSK